MSKTTYPDVLSKIKEGVSRGDIIKYICNKYKVKSSRAGEIYRTENGKINEGLVISTKYTYNKETDTYIIPLKCRSKPLVCGGARHRAICRDYSAWNGDLTANEISLKYKLTPEIFSEYRRIFNLTKEREPLSAEEVWENTEDESVEAILEQKRYSVYQKFEKEDWKSIQKDANKWREFQSQQVDPFQRFLETWNPPKYIAPTSPVKLSQSDSAVIINIADIHVGAKADGRFLYRQRDWKHSDLEESMAEYSKKIRREIYSRQNAPQTAFLTLGGDILHTLTGYTDGGTKLDYEFIGEDQIDFAVTLLVSFIKETLTTFNKVYVKSVSGNHSYLGDYVVAKLLSTYFRNEKRIDFEISTKRYLPFKVLDTLVILDHGASGKGIKSKMPGGVARDSYIKSILLDRPELLVGTNCRVFLSNDKHHYEYIEKADFDLIISPSIVAGDLYSDFNAWKSRPAQCIFVIDKNGVKESIRFYFD